MRVDENIGLEEAKTILKKYITRENLELLDESFDLSDIWDMSFRKGVIYNDDGVPAALVGVCVLNFRNFFWMIALEGLRKNIRDFIKFLRNIDFDGEVFTQPDDPKARLIKIAGGIEDSPGIWKLKESGYGR